MEAAIAQWEKAASARPADGETLSKLARAYFFLADAHLRKLGPKGTSDLYLTTFEKGVAAGERALAAISPAFKARVTQGDKVEEAIQVVGREGLEAMYWYSANLGKWARAKGFATNVGNKDRVKGVMRGIDPVHLGVVFIVNMEIGYLAPPIATNLFIASSIFRRPFGQVTRAVLPTLAILCAGLLVITYVPTLSVGVVHALRGGSFYQPFGATAAAAVAPAPVGAPPKVLTIEEMMRAAKEKREKEKE